MIYDIKQRDTRPGGQRRMDLLWPSVKHVVDSLLRTLPSSVRGTNFITFCRR